MSAVEITYRDARGVLRTWEALERVEIEGIVVMVAVTPSGDRIYVATRKYQDGGPLLDVLGVQAYDRGTGALVWEQSLLPAGGAPAYAVRSRSLPCRTPRPRTSPPRVRGRGPSAPEQQP